MTEVPQLTPSPRGKQISRGGNRGKCVGRVPPPVFKILRFMTSLGWILYQDQTIKLFFYYPMMDIDAVVGCRCVYSTMDKLRLTLCLLTVQYVRSEDIPKLMVMPHCHRKQGARIEGSEIKKENGSGPGGPTSTLPGTVRRHSPDDSRGGGVTPRPPQE